VSQVSQADVLVIGAGILGVSVAYHLAKRKYRVCILEREDGFAQHASSKNAGMFRLLYRHPQLTDWAYRARQGWPSAARDIAYQQTGSLIVARHVPDHHPTLFQQTTIQTSNGPQPAVYTPLDGLVTPYDLVHGIYQETNRHYARYHFREEITRLERIGDHWEAESQNGNRFRAPWVINAAGAWLNRFLAPSLPQLTVAAQPFARHLFVVEGWQQQQLPAENIGYYWDEETSWYVRLWENNERLVSICDQTPATPETFVPAPDINERLALRLLHEFPTEGEHLCLGTSWHCFRTYTEDLRPIWGEDPDAKGLFWLSAFGGFGMSTSFGAAEDAAKAIHGEPHAVPDAFGPKRVRHTS
jgi:D-arginine dehydrogenase